MSVENQDVQTSETTQENVVVDSSNQLDETLRQQLEFALSNEIQQSTEQPSETNTEVPAGEQPQVQATETPVFDEAAFFQEFGVASKDELKARLEELNTLRTTPQTAAEIAFANEESKKIHQLLKEGKTQEVKKYLDGQEMLATYDNMSDEQKLKLYIKSTNPLFDSELVEDEYTSLYSVDEENFEGDEIKLRREKVKAQQRLMNDVQKANEYFSTYRQKIELPEIQSIQSTPDAEYEAYKASIAQADQTYQRVTVPSINALKESDLGVSLTINDPANQFNFGVSVAVDKSDLEAAKKQALDFNGFLESFWEGEKFDAKRLTRLILLDKKFDNFVQTAARQGAMAERKRVIEKETVGGGSTQRQTTNVQAEKTPFEKQMEYALS
jgi:hypothetical protein